MKANMGRVAHPTLPNLSGQAPIHIINLTIDNLLGSKLEQTSKEGVGERFQTRVSGCSGTSLIISSIWKLESFRPNSHQAMDVPERDSAVVFLSLETTPLLSGNLETSPLLAGNETSPLLSGIERLPLLSGNSQSRRFLISALHWLPVKTWLMASRMVRTRMAALGMALVEDRPSEMEKMTALEKALVEAQPSIQPLAQPHFVYSAPQSTPREASPWSSALLDLPLELLHHLLLLLLFGLLDAHRLLHTAWLALQISVPMLQSLNQDPVLHLVQRRQ